MKCASVAAVCLLAISIQAGQFVNLGFEDANCSEGSGGGPVSEMLPGWRIFYGTNEQFGIGFNAIPDSGYISSVYDRHQFPTIEGQYSLAVRNSLGGPSWVFEQQGDVPPGTRMLSYTGTVWTVKANGAVVPPIIRPVNGAAINQVFYDFSNYAGKTITLDFVSASESQDPLAQSAGGLLDSIAFVVCH